MQLEETVDAAADQFPKQKVGGIKGVAEATIPAASRASDKTINSGRRARALQQPPVSVLPGFILNRAVEPLSRRVREADGVHTL
ncbi:MAG: hypothetical protein WBG92_02645 [Thiohalocapsa sp.]